MGKAYRLCVGSYNFRDVPGIYLFDLDVHTGDLRLLDVQCQSVNSSFLAFDSRCLYAVNEVEAETRIDAYRWAEGYTRLEYLGGVPILGSAMCHLLLWPGGKYISGANYASGSFVVCPLEDDGCPGAPVYYGQHTGVGFDEAFRQEGPHVHSTCLAPDGKRLLVADLGLDWVAAYCTGGAGGRLRLAGEGEQIRLPGGAGPRHMVFGGCGTRLYVLAEMGCKVCVYGYGQGRAASLLQVVDLLPEGCETENLSADIHLSPDGRFLYASNRGQDDLAIFHVGGDGLLAPAGRCPTGRGPRSFCLTPDGRYIVVASQQGGTVQVLARNTQNGLVGVLVCERKLPQPSFVGILECKEERG